MLRSELYHRCGCFSPIARLSVGRAWPTLVSSWPLGDSGENGIVRGRAIFRPGGPCLVPTFTHGSRRGLHSYAAPRLGGFHESRFNRVAFPQGSDAGRTAREQECPRYTG
jgi:hypothetical protein